MKPGEWTCGSPLVLVLLQSVSPWLRAPWWPIPRAPIGLQQSA
jgi:hypothetical protein